MEPLAKVGLEGETQRPPDGPGEAAVSRAAWMGEN